MGNISVTVEAEKSAHEWHDYAKTAESNKTLCTLQLGQAWYELRETEGYREVDPEMVSVYQYVAKYFNKPKGTTDKWIRLHLVYEKEFNIPKSVLGKIGWGKLDITVSHITQDNKLEVLQDLENLTQKDLRMKYAKSQEDVESENLQFKPYRMEVFADDAGRENFDTAFDLAKKDYAAETSVKEELVSYTQALEVITSSYLTNRPINDETQLETLLCRIEKAFNIEIEYEYLGEDEGEENEVAN